MNTIPIGYKIDRSDLAQEESGYLNEAMAAYPDAYDKALLFICDSQSDIDECREKGIACIAYDPGGMLHHSWILQSFEGLDDEYIYKAYCRQMKIPLRMIETERTYLREFCLDDLDDLFSMYETPHTTDYIEPLYEYDEEREYQINYIKYMYEIHDYGIWLVFDKKTDELIGRAGVESKRELEPNEVEMGYLITYERRGQGLATEVCTAIMDWARNHPDIDTIYCNVDPENAVSIKLLKNLGFDIQKTDDELRAKKELR